MIKISMFEYQERLVSIASAIERAFPRFKVCRNHDEIWVRSAHCSGAVTLKVDYDGTQLVMRPDVSFGSGTALLGSLDAVALGILDYQCMHGVMLQAKQALEGVVVVRDAKTEAAS